MPIVSIDGENLKFQVASGDVIFDALDKHGHKLPHGCLSGSCGACRIEVTEGRENLQIAAMVEKNTIESIKQNYQRMNGANSMDNREVRLSCRARVTGDIKIKPLK